MNCVFLCVHALNGQLDLISQIQLTLEPLKRTKKWLLVGETTLRTFFCHYSACVVYCNGLSECIDNAVGEGVGYLLKVLLVIL